MLNDELEACVDKHGLFAVLDALSGICGQKAEHVATNWQDTKLAKDWAQAEAALDAASNKVLDLF